MTLLFAAGVMNLFWIAAISALVLLEKLFPAPRLVSGTAGAVLLVWGGWLLMRSA
jgi:predicted metal-binding membrane protein